MRQSSRKLIEVGFLRYDLVNTTEEPIQGVRLKNYLCLPILIADLPRKQNSYKRKTCKKW